MTRLTPLWESPHLHIRRFDHPHDYHDHADDGAQEMASRFIASVVEKGRFRLDAEGRSWELGPGDVMLSRPGMEFSVQHIDADFSDVCLSVCFDSAQIEALDAQSLWPRLREPLRRANDRLAYLHWGVERAVDFDVALQAETCAAELLNEIAHDRLATDTPFRPSKLRWYAERVHAVRERLDANLGDDHRLADLAGSAAMSPFNFARVFQRLVGVPPHRYLLLARLRAAAAMLDEGSSVTAACFACGFSSPGHFGRLFAREFGALPSAFRRQAMGPHNAAGTMKPARNCKRGACNEH